jgi:hypothetical protein
VEREGRVARLPRRPTGATARGAALAILLVLAAVVGIGLRFAGLEWDDGHHLHPDERYLSIVANDIRGPATVAEYFDVEQSRLSPYNVDSGRSYVYGQLPLLGTKLIASVLGRDGYGELHLVGRHISALLDAASILLVFLVGRLLFAPLGRKEALGGALLASALYGLSVTAIQHAHFFTVEAWLVCTTLLAFLLGAYASRPRKLEAGLSYGLLLAAGAAVGLAISTKLGGGLVALPVVLGLAGRALGAQGTVRSRVGRLALEGLVLALGAYVSFRLTSPYAFASSSWLDVRPHERFRDALEQQRAALDGDFLFPPAYQWLLSDPAIDPARNLLGWGLGPALGLTAVIGLGILAVPVARALRSRTWTAARSGIEPLIAAMVVAYVLVVFLAFSVRFTHSLRYLLPIVPFLCLAAAGAILSLRRFRVARAVVGGAVLVATLAWALAFTTVYREPHTRVAASQWINANVPAGATIVNEHWDDGLPVGGLPDRYRLRQLPVFDPDDAAKLAKLYAGLRNADLYVLSSPRAWRTIGRLPDRFPLMARFYERLRAGELGWEPVARFSSPPRLLGVRVDDLDAEETFWVYDHPPVELYRRSRAMSRRDFERALCARPAPVPACP